MKTSRIHQLFLVSVVIIVTFALACASYAQKTDLRESPRDDAKDRKLVPVSRDQQMLNVKVWMDKQCGSPYYTGEKALIYFSTDVDGYLTLYDIGTQGDVLVIFPNRHTPDNYVKAGQTIQIPAVQASYDLIVEGPAGIEYIEAVASVDPSYHWDYRQGEPRWLKDLNLEGQKGSQYEARTMDQQTASAYRKSTEYQNAPEGLGSLGVKSLERNFQLSRSLREEVRSKLVVRPREDQQSGGSVQPVSEQKVDYSTASCYFYVVEGRPTGQTQPISSQTEYLQQQAQDFQRIPGFNVQSRDDRLLVAIPGRILFDSGSSALRTESWQDLNQVGTILVRYPETDIMVMGHTDSRGEAAYNQQLSEQRARAVSDYLVSRGVEPYRISYIGYGETMPVASNDTESGRQQNRRVELDIRVSPRYGQ